MTESPARLWLIWHEAAAQPQVDQALRDLYAELDRQVAARGPTCWLSGQCCHFDAYGHRLYVTGLEIAWVLQQVAPPKASHSEGCVYQINRLCSAHAARPLGCRIFFCQAGTQDWQRQLYEDYLVKLRALHDTHDLPYRYIEWRMGLAEAITHGRSPRSA